jgi:hypothetical protein
MQKKIAFNLRLRRKDTGEEHDRLIFAADETAAKERGIERAKLGINKPMIDRKYAQFDVLSCVIAGRS